MKNKYFFLYILICIFIGLGLSSCGKKENKTKEKDKIIIESFDYEINRSRSIVANELSYNLSFDIDFTLNHKFNVEDLVVRIATIEEAIENKIYFQFNIDSSNTEDINLSSSTEKFPYILLKYAIVGVTTFDVNAQIKITSNDLIDDINNFIKIDCYCESKEIVDENSILNNGTFKMSYSDDSLIHYEFDEFSESYKVVSVIAKSDTFEVPAIYNGYPVKTIGEGAFYGCSNIKNIIIPDSVTYIARDAFEGCDNIEKATIPAIAAPTLPRCLKEVIITSGTSIENSAFYNCSNLASINLPDSVTSIGDYVFAGCQSLTTIKIPDSVTSIGIYAFYNCSNLASITIPFVGASLNETENTHFGYIFGANTYSDNSSYVPSSLKEVIITGGKNIGASAFWYCSGLTSIDLPNSVISIGSFAFSNCSKLARITIPSNILRIGDSAFENCISLEFNNYDNENYYIGNKENPYVVLIKARSRDIINCEINGNTKFIYDNAFQGCRALASLVIPDSVTSIGSFAFSNCSSLTSIVIPASVKHIGASAFDSCINIEQATIPTNAISSIPNDSIKKVVITSGTSIKNYAFSGCSNLTSITIPDSVTSIGSDAFSGCSNLTSITVPASVTSIKYAAFKDCSSLASIVIPDSVTSIGSDAFSGCSNLTSITIPNSVTSIGHYAFYNCSSLTSVVIPKSVTSIGVLAFHNCISLVSITIPFVGASLNTHFGYIFGANTYSDNSNYVPNSLKEVILTGGDSIESHAFLGCSSLTSIKIPESVKNIGKYAFYNCGSLTRIVIPKSVTMIGNYAFANCNSLKEVYYNGTSNEWNNISLGVQNINLTSATIYYYSETEPTEEGNYWHYVDGTPTKW